MTLGIYIQANIIHDRDGIRKGTGAKLYLLQR
jgi:hypothetical protein